ncbi:MAG: hypothetical protein GY774_28425 [Planctomycetes bacterium]|nr:hypothetical protein [Planctomycetota bacterium]
MTKIIFQNLTLAMLIVATPSVAISLGSEGLPSVADAGLSRYAGSDPVVLDGTGSYDPDNSGNLSYSWQQISGQSVIISDSNSAIPTISGFVQTDKIQECQFELVVSEGELTSLPDTVTVTIVPYFGEDRFELLNDTFDPRKPTIIYYGGGDCTHGTVMHSLCPIASSKWLSKANVISYPNGYSPDTKYENTPTYYHLGDMIIVYLSSMAPNYKQPIQTIGWSTGGRSSIDVGIRLNRVYQDARYAVNRVTHLDADCGKWASRVEGGRWEEYTQAVESFLNSSVDGEPCWVEHYWGDLGRGQIPKANILAVDLPGFNHPEVRAWYGSSINVTDTNRFNHGLVAGAYLSVVGPGSNLQLTKQNSIHYFRWSGTNANGSMGFVNEELYPGRLPEPVKLIGPVKVDPNGVILTCEESENAVSYQLLFGPDPYCLMDYYIVSETPDPPNEIITTFPFDETWWTVKVTDQYGSTIYADPRRLNAFILSLPIENITTGKRYGYIQEAINEALAGDQIIIEEGIYNEKIIF